MKTKLSMECDKLMFLPSLEHEISAMQRHEGGACYSSQPLHMAYYTVSLKPRSPSAMICFQYVGEESRILIGAADVAEDYCPMESQLNLKGGCPNRQQIQTVCFPTNCRVTTQDGIATEIVCGPRNAMKAGLT